MSRRHSLVFKEDQQTLYNMESSPLFSGRQSNNGPTQKFKISEVLTFSDVELNEVLQKVKDEERLKNKTSMKDQKKQIVINNQQFGTTGMMFSTVHQTSREWTPGSKKTGQQHVKELKVIFKSNSKKEKPIDRDQPIIIKKKAKLTANQRSLVALNKMELKNNQIQKTTIKSMDSDINVLPRVYQRTPNKERPTNGNSLSNNQNLNLPVLPKLQVDLSQQSLLNKDYFNQQSSSFLRPQKPSFIENINSSLQKSLDQSKIQKIINEKQKHQQIKNQQQFTKQFTIQKNLVVKIINQTLSKLKKMHLDEQSKCSVELRKERQKARTNLVKQIQNKKPHNMQEISKELKFEAPVIDIIDQNSSPQTKKVNSKSQKTLLPRHHLSMMPSQMNTKPASPQLFKSKLSQIRLEKQNNFMGTSSSPSMMNSLQEDELRNYQEQLLLVSLKSKFNYQQAQDHKGK